MVKCGENGFPGEMFEENVYFPRHARTKYM